jgi:two-component system CheB/CheR fusion protein
MNRPAKLLYIEDDELDRRTFVRMIHEAQLPWDVQHADTLAAARTLLAHSRFDVIVADYHLPDGESTELFGEITDTPFVLLTGTLEEELALRTLERGADDYLVKDPQHHALEALPFTIEKTLYRKSIHQEAQRLTCQLRESEEKFRVLAENAPVAFAIIQGTRFAYANPYLAEVSGYTVEEITSMEFAQMVHPGFREMVMDRARRRLMGEPVPRQYEFLMVTKSGEARWIDLSPAVIEYGGKPAIIGVGLDITERKRTQEALRQTEQRLAAFMQHLPGAAWIKDAEGRYIYANPEAERIFGMPLVQLRGKTDNDIFPPPTARQLCENDRRVLTEGGSVETTEVVRQPDGVDHHSIVRKFALPGPEGQGAVVAGVAFDITERIRIEAELEKAKAAAEEASQAKDRFLAVLSHELRTPLSPVLAAVSLLQKNPFLDEQTHKDLELIRRNVELEARLIDDLLDLARIARGRIELDKRPVELCSVISRAVEVCRPDIDARRLHFGVDMGRDAPYIVEADIARLQQVFWNLLKNSIKFTPHGGCVGVRCRLVDGYVVAEVNDTGIGIEPEILPRIFSAFAQAERAITRQFGGLGLGLAISKSLVELHGGSIEAFSHGKGKGATFTVRLPCLAASVSLQQQPAPPPPRQQRLLRLLVVEDHGDTADMIRLMLESEGHEVVLAGDVESALERAGQDDFDLLISDLGLPDGSGLDLMRELQARGHKLPGIALSGYGQDSDIAQSRAAGFVAHIIKPIDMDRLASILAEVSSRSP